MPEEEQKGVAEKRPQDRSPSFPYIGLSKAFERAEALYNYTKRHETRIIDAAKPAWNLGAKSSGTLQTVAALLAYGLIEDNGSGENRKIKVSDATYRAVADPRPGTKNAILAEAALKPKLIAEFYEKWGNDRPPEATCIGELAFERGFTPDGAKAFLKVYDDTTAYVEAPRSDKKNDSERKETEVSDPQGSPISVGDFIRIEVGGQIVVEKAAVRALQEHGGHQYVFVEGLEAGALISDATLLEKAAAHDIPPKLPLMDQAVRAIKIGWKEERLIDDEGGEILISYEGEPSTARYEFIRDYLDFKVKRAKKAS